MARKVVATLKAPGLHPSAFAFPEVVDITERLAEDEGLHVQRA